MPRFSRSHEKTSMPSFVPPAALSISSGVFHSSNVAAGAEIGASFAQRS
jgi:hypothetical protein